MRHLVRSAWVIARRDYVATVWSKAFLLFLIGPLMPIIFGVVIASVGGEIDQGAGRPGVAVALPAADAAALRAAEARLAPRIGRALPRLTRGDGESVRLEGSLAAPRLTGPAHALDDLAGPVALLVDTARAERTPGLPPPARLVLRPLGETAQATPTDRAATARGGQLALLVLTMILAGMLLSNLIEEKSSKVIEVLAAAVPIDAVFLGKLAAMLAMSLTGIAIWGAMALAATGALLPPGADLPPPAVGWPLFVALGVAYFVMSYLLLGAVFLGIGAQAGSVREVQTLSMPVTMAQLVVFALASAAVANPNGHVATAAALFPWSAPFAMIARAAQAPTLWTHALALAWQALWVVLAIRLAARAFRASVLNAGSGGGNPLARLWRRWR